MIRAAISNLGRDSTLPVPSRTVVLVLSGLIAGGGGAPLDIGSRRELFVHEARVDHLKGNAQLRLHHPGVSLLAKQPVRRRFELKDADVYAFQFLKQHKNNLITIGSTKS
jgi:hypothetical protein